MCVMANRKDNAMKTTENTHEWLMARGRGGVRRIETLGWKRLAKMYFDAKPGSPIRKAINAEARRCGYTPRVILALNA